jgi:hypothetical protein
MEELPKAIGRAGEMMSYLSRPQTRIDPDKEDPHARLNTVRQSCFSAHVTPDLD